ncbi:four helix bundle protein [Algoriphagus lutimaris]|uniref:four helix bundle protein n=1 Tax=Algoriphagus lutimaris TaxID=613197 RepID=UPI00196AE94D|nr:four helix bundle protein [Algoriphagus lutimaris]MBN3520794.1 four helix bundle protein [Algoriphagus lutimaris]
MTRADTFEDLRCWQLAYKLKGEIKTKVIPCLPDSEKYELRSQLLRASRSTTANIAEGWGRFHFLESNKFYYYSRGSLSELLDHLIEIKDNGFIEEEVYS